MAAPQFDSVVDGLVTTLRAASGLGTPGDSSGDVPVYDGPVPTNEPVLTFVAVGWDGNDESDGRAVSFTQDWHDIGGTASRDEDTEVQCWLACSDGGSDFSTLRSTASTTFGLVSDALRATPALGLTSALWCHITSGEVVQGVSPAGAFVGIQFTVSVRSLI